MSRPTVPPPKRDDHLWSRRQLATAAAGLLPDSDEERLQAHLEACADCRESWRKQMLALAGEGPEADPDGERHLPPAMIARWGLATQTLAGLEREMVRRHLERCGKCQADLEALGHNPELAVAPVLRAVVRPRRSFGAGLAWGVGVTALAAVAAGLIFLPSPSDPESTMLPWVAPVTLRGGHAATVDLAADATGFTVLATVPADLDPRRSASVTVVDPTGDNLMTAVVTPEMQASRTISIVIRDQEGIAGGDYRVVFTQTADDGSELVRESAFNVKLLDVN